MIRVLKWALIILCSSFLLFMVIRKEALLGPDLSETQLACRNLLIDIFYNQHRFYCRYGYYSSNYDDIAIKRPNNISIIFGQRVIGESYDFPNCFYRYAGKDSFAIYAMANTDKDGCLEIWNIDNLGKLRHISDDTYCDHYELYKIQREGL